MPDRTHVQLKPRDFVRLSVTVTARQRNPWNLAVPPGQYQRTWQDGNDLKYGYCRTVYPPFVTETTVGQGRLPRMIRDQRGRLTLFWVDGSGASATVYYARSDSEGRTWDAPATLGAGLYAAATFAPALQRLVAFVYSGGALVGYRQQAGSVAGFTSFSPGISADEDSFHLTPIPGTPGQWLLAVRQSGAVSVLWSADNAQTWNTLQAGLLSSGRRPTVVAEPGTGIVLAAAYRAERLVGVWLMPAAYSFTGEAVFRDASGEIEFANDGFGIVVAPEAPGRWILTARAKGESQIGEWWSADWGRTWTRVI